MSNQEEVELRAKIEALGLEVTKVPEQTPKQLDEVTAMLLLPHPVAPLSTNLYMSYCLITFRPTLSSVRDSCRAGQAVGEAR